MAKKKTNDEQINETGEQINETGEQQQEEATKERCMSFRASEEFTAEVRSVCDRTGVSYARARGFLSEAVEEFLAGMNVKSYLRSKTFGDD